MPYVLGIDIGSTNTTAAVSRFRGTWSGPEVIHLDVPSPAVPSVLHMSTNGTLTVGDPGRYGEVLEGARVARGFIHRVGDDVPLLVGGESCPPQALAAILAMWVVEQVVAKEGGQPEQTVLTHPANWGPFRKKVLHEALWEIGLTNVSLLPAPVAAAEAYALRGFTGQTLAVYAIGGDRSESAVVRHTRPAGFELVNGLAGITLLGGADFDDALVDQVRGEVGRDLRDTGDPQVRLALLRLRRECVRAKERLSTANETDVLVELPHGAPRRVPLSRVQFEDLIRPAVRQTVDGLLRTIRGVGIAPTQLDGLLLVGGSARIPLIAELLAAELPVPVEVEADPQTTVAAGAALAARQVIAPASSPAVPRPAGGRGEPTWPPRPPTIRRPTSSRSAPPPGGPAQSDGSSAPPPRPPVTISELELPVSATARLFPNRGMMILGLAVLAIVLGVVLTFAFGPDTFIHADSAAVVPNDNLRPGPS